MKFFSVLVLLTTLISCALCAPPTCSAYCTVVMANCNGTNVQYSSMTDCTNQCGKLPLGTDDAATSGNDIGCRTYHANAALSLNDPVTHCPHAGPSGGGVCGSVAEAYCAITISACPMVFTPATAAPFCAYTAPLYPAGNITDKAGNTLGCRLYHAGVASTDVSHCSHTSPSGDGPCGTPCEAYCQLAMTQCTGANALYTDAASCALQCATMKLTDYTDQGNNSVQCRIYHALASGVLNMRDVHCPHATHSGGNVCGSWCENYCYYSMKTCTGANSHNYTDNAACMTECAAFNSTGKPGDASGDTVQCRIYHLSAAAVDSASATTHCPHASKTGGGVCGTAAPTTSTTAAPTSSTTAAPTTGDATKLFGIFVVLVLASLI